MTEDEWTAELAAKGLVNIDPLLPYLRQGPRADSEWIAHCPLHEDANPSMSINFLKGRWFCHAGCGGGRIAQLLGTRDTWVPAENHPGIALQRR